jgi:hypothetical protein
VANSNFSHHILTQLLGRLIAFVFRSGYINLNILVCLISLCLNLGWQLTVLAEPKADPSLPEICEVDLNLLKFNSENIPANIVTADTASATMMTLPSLWWTRDQTRSKVVSNWIADRTQKQIYLLINAQYWNILDYIDRYALIDKFGRVSRDYGYNLRLCTERKIVLAEYQCDRIANLSNCYILLNAAGQAAARIEN